MFALAVATLGTGWAQKIEVGTYVFKKDGAVYTGDLYNGNPTAWGALSLRTATFTKGIT